MRSHDRHHHLIRSSFLVTGLASAFLMTFLSVLPGFQQEAHAQAAVDIFPKIPSVANVALPSTQLVNGAQVLSRFTVKSTTKDVFMDQLSFLITSKSLRNSKTAYTPVTMEGFSVRVAGEASDIAGVVSSGCNPVSATACRVVVNIPNFSVPAGVARTIELRANVGGVDLAGESIRTTLEKPFAVHHTLSYPQGTTPAYQSNLTGTVGAQGLSRN
jgi:hypothetical protein